jgi:hypothetical protein
MLSEAERAGGDAKTCAFPPASGGRAERRRAPRVREPFLLGVCGRSRGGRPFALNTLVDNISAAGLYARLGCEVSVGDELLLEVWLTCDPEAAPVARVSIRGEVVRAEPMPSGACGVAVAFSDYRFV